LKGQQFLGTDAGEIFGVEIQNKGLAQVVLIASPLTRV